MGEVKKRGVFLSDCKFWSLTAENFLRPFHDALFDQYDYIVIDLDTVRHKRIEPLLEHHDFKIYGVSNRPRKREKYSYFLEAVFCKTISIKKIIKFATDDLNDESRFNNIELSLLRFLKQGFSDSIIAKKQRLPMSTVKYYLRCLYEKLGVENRTQAAMVAVKNNI